MIVTVKMGISHNRHRALHNLPIAAKIGCDGAMKRLIRMHLPIWYQQLKMFCFFRYGPIFVTFIVNID